MSYAEFPSTILHLEDGDHHELIEFYIEVRDKYQGTLNEIEQLRRDLTQYRADMQAEISSTVEQTVTRQLAVSLSDIESRLAKLTDDALKDRRRIDTLETSNQEIYRRLDSINDKLMSEINKVYTEIYKVHNAMLGELKKIDTRIDNVVSETDTRIDNVVSETDTKISAGDAATLINANNYSYMLDARTRRELEDKIANISATASAEAISWIWQYGCCHGGFTAGEWYHLTNICNLAWSAVSPSAWEWYVMGKDMFSKYRRRNKVYSPVSGKYVDVRIALLELAEKLKINGISAEDYDRLELSATDYENCKISAEDYDWNGRDVLNV